MWATHAGEPPPLAPTARISSWVTPFGTRQVWTAPVYRNACWCMPVGRGVGEWVGVRVGVRVGQGVGVRVGPVQERAVGVFVTRASAGWRVSTNTVRWSTVAQTRFSDGTSVVGRSCQEAPPSLL